MIIPDSQVTEWAFGSSAAGVMDPAREREPQHRIFRTARAIWAGAADYLCVCESAVWSDGQKEKGEGGAYMYVYSSRPVYIYIYILEREKKNIYI